MGSSSAFNRCNAAGGELSLLQGTVQWQLTASNRASWSVLLSLLVRSNTPLSSPALVTLTFIQPSACSLSIPPPTPHPSVLSLPPFPSPPFCLPHLFALSPRICLPSNSRRLKQPGLLREVNCTQIMFDRKRSEGATEERHRDGGEMEGGMDVRVRR